MWLGLAGPATRPDQTVQEMSAGQCNPDERSGIFAVVYCSMSPLLSRLCSNEECEIEMKSNFKLFFLSYQILFLASILRSPITFLDSYHLSLSQSAVVPCSIFPSDGQGIMAAGPKSRVVIVVISKKCKVCIMYVVCSM